MGATVAFTLATAVGTVYVYTAQILTHVVAGGFQRPVLGVVPHLHRGRRSAGPAHRIGAARALPGGA